MARISGVNLPNEKRVEVGLTYIFGIGLSTAQKILNNTKINPDTKVKDLTEGEINQLREAIDTMKVEGDLRREVTTDIRRLKEIGAYRGARHTAGLPVRGQRTKTNGRTKRGRKVTVGSGKRKAEKT